MNDFWISSGHHLLDRDANGHLVVTDEFLKALLARPEIIPPQEACAAERALHAKLLADPRADVGDREIAAMADEDARENWQVLLAFRALLLGSPSLEAAYLRQFRDKRQALPWLFANQLTHLILRNALDRETDDFVLKAAELFFRRQTVSYDGGMLLLADADLVEDRQVAAHASPLLAMFQGNGAGDLDVLSDGNKHGYRLRSDAFDMVLDFRAGGAARAALGRVIEIWVRHLLGLHCVVEPLSELKGERWSWFIGLDPQATEIGNALWAGKEPPKGGAERILGLYRLDLKEPHMMLDHVAGEPIYLILAMDEGKSLQMKPQNLITGLPLKEGQAV